MKAQKLPELYNLIKSDQFQAWQGKLENLQQRESDLRTECQELELKVATVSFRAEYFQRAGDSSLFAAGDMENRSHEYLAEHESLDNDSFEILSQFQEANARVNTRSIDFDQVDKELEDIRITASERRRELQAQGSNGATEEDIRLQELERKIKALGESAGAARVALEHEQHDRDSLWGSIEESWQQAFRANMARSEYLYQSRKCHSKAEKLFALAEEERVNLKSLRDRLETVVQSVTEAVAAQDSLLTTGAGNFSCTVVDDFLFWPNEEDVQSVFCVPVLNDNSHFNIQIKSRKVYQLDKEKGLDFMEPVAEDGGSGELDPRLESFFSDLRPSS
ncbi:MAG: hypothetical protein VYA34_04165 [Myxococcota bacterium]|nr:hypothetical protein [Myxococcota bacterium]